MDYSQYKGLIIEKKDGIARVTMRYQSGDRATEAHQHTELGTIWQTLDNDPDVKVVLLTGFGEKEFYFSTKTHTGLKGTWENTVWMEKELQAIFGEMIRFSKPVIAAINGTATGAGLTVALLSDITVMAEDAWLGDGHTTMGISAGDGVGTLWPLFTGIAKAKLYLLTGDAIDAREAERIGLIGRVVPRAQLMHVATDYASRLAKGPIVALRFTKRGVNQYLRQAGIFLQDYACALEALSAFSGESRNAPYTEFPPRQVRGC